ncbi:hypothetical protein Csp2054_14190 [Curtobacterium sp. 'Ferrero']|uniref:hypothetical protein n=1 Tax=Curtobacterium sp. 'Ferrero' TaxID=2033654 RepID=UPI000BD6351D|nr:hypothetical protein [Curtobacterium sp. 'Ferrero']PCN46989.1 hypothetical protein Csp2054_14190 [Curtobacterium sp. 'Ferrero']
MNQTEVAKLLTVASAIDNRTVSDEQVIAWHAALRHLPFEVAQEALVRHFRDSTEYLLPGHISKQAKVIRAEQEREARIRRQIEPPRPITLDRPALEAETAQWTAFYRQHPEQRALDAGRVP